MKRREFIAATVFGTAAAAATPVWGSYSSQDDVTQLDSELVRKFVGASHGRIDAVKEMLASQPMLVNASWDWVDGDWETGLGAASHVGNRDIANFLLDNGARIDIFAMTMLGHGDMVKAVLKAYPKTHEVPGPHGIPLLNHAIFGKEQANEVFNLLLEAKANVNASSNNGQTALMAAAGSGRVDQVERLLDLGADIDAKDSRDRTALDWAKARERTKVVQFFKSR